MNRMTETERHVKMTKRRAETSDVIVTNMTLFQIQVCAPFSMTPEEVEREANLINYCGTVKGWMLSEDPKCAPVICSDDWERMHYILEA